MSQQSGLYDKTIHLKCISKGHPVKMHEVAKNNQTQS